MSKASCGICPHHCTLEEGQTGLCRARSNRNGTIVSDNYGCVTSLALDSIEKKPLRRFHPGKRILSAGSFGCNLRCPFCQNHAIAASGVQNADFVRYSPEELVKQAIAARAQGNIGLAFTYNEPLVGFEYVRDCAHLAAGEGLYNVLVTNGFINEEPLRELLPLIHAMNIDLKGFTDTFYHKLGGDLENVKRTIEICASACHVEVTTLVIPGENDSLEEMRELSRWLASVRPDIALHVTRFFPRYQMTDRAATPVDTVYRLAEIAREALEYVYVGNC